MTPNQTLQQAADTLGLPVESLIEFLQAMRQVMNEAELNRTESIILNLPKIIER